MNFIWITPIRRRLQINSALQGRREMFGECCKHKPVILISLGWQKRKENKSEYKTQLEIMCAHKMLGQLAQLEAELVKKDKLLGEMKEQNQNQKELLNAPREDKQNQCQD
eukprot:3511177-Ditylum_brightwellii.AAC.1